MTPFEDVLELKAACTQKHTQLGGLHSYTGLGHAFSPRIGLNNWQDTVSPLDVHVAQDIASAVQELFQRE